MTKTEHLAQCKKRALEYIDEGSWENAYASMVSDMRKHPETAKHSAIDLGFQLIFAGELETAEKMRKFIEGFN